MVTDIEYAQLANRVYNRTDENRTPVPTGLGWTEKKWLPDAALKKRGQAEKKGPGSN